LRHGNGTEKYANGNFYIGHFREGEYDGTGKYIWKNGSSYSGQFKNGMKHGKGKWIVKDSNPDETGDD
jgi:1-phosphatidylinositol-4-phosphate 5-kinase